MDQGESESNVIAQLDTLYLDTRIEKSVWGDEIFVDSRRKGSFNPLQHISFHSLRLESML